jgi:uncharacterized RDD family membrane protein YckC
MPWQSKTSDASGRLLPPSLEFADTPSRATAYILDTLVFTAVNSVSASIFGLYSFTVPNFPDRSAFVATTLVGFAFLFAYFVWFWSGGRRATPGQRVFAIQVGNAFDGQPLTLRQAVKRTLGFGMPIGLLALLPFLVVGIGAFIIGLLWSLLLLASTITSETKQGLHDRFAGSALVRPAGVGNRWAAGCLVVFLLFAVVEGLFGIWFITNPTASSLPPEYWEKYLRWLWPS